MKKQSLITQKGEIEFRKKLIEQQIQGKVVFKDEYEAFEIERILKERMNKTMNDMNALREKGIPISPFIEIGAERCQRSLVMENDLHSNGAAVDISFDMLVSGDYYRRKMNKKNNPLRICCDAYSLPFGSGSVPFVFCYETLHHFPELTPIINEIYRVLAPGGVFFFDEEPFKKILHVNLYTNQKAYSKNTRTRSTIKKVLDYFLAKNMCNETDHNIIENESLSIGEWEQSLKIFDDQEVHFKTPVRFIGFNLSNKKNQYIRLLLSFLLGGTVTGKCRKSTDGNYQPLPIQEVIICPICRTEGCESILNVSSSSVVCAQCTHVFPIINDVIMLFTEKKLNELYHPGFQTAHNNLAESSPAE